MTAALAASEAPPVPLSVDVVRRRAAHRRSAVVGGVVVALLVTAAVAMSSGDSALALADLWRTLWGGGDRLESYIVFQVRAPRVVTALLVGSCLGVSGALLQALLQNPLASPDLLGISGGSGAGAVFALTVLGASGPLLALFAFLGGFAVAGVLLLAGTHRGDGGYRLVLAGVGFAFLGTAVTGYLLVRAKVEIAQSAYIWLVGSLATTPWWNALVLFIVTAASLPAVLLCARWLPILQLGRSTAVSLGVPAERVRTVAVLTAVVLTATTCAFAGPLAFVALCAPAIARPLLGHGAVALGVSAGVGATLLIVADLIAQFAIPGMSVPVGVVTGALGAVFLLWLLATSKGRTL